MSPTPATIEVRLERTIAAPAEEVYNAWLDPKVPGTPWNMADKLLLNPHVDGFFYWLYREYPHYGRFTQIEKPARMQYTWVSPNTAGLESVVTVTFQPQGTKTLMTLTHTGLPDTDAGRSHEKGWTHFLDLFPTSFAAAPTNR